MSAPVAAGERIDTLDILRGFAVLGILIMNISAFANLDAAYSNPTLGGFTGADYWVWYFSHLFANMKFITVFSALFGAGVLLMTSKREARGESAKGLHYRRMMYLWIFGMLHAYFMWWGDILVWYALTGLWLYLFRRCRTKTLIIWGLAFITFVSLLMVVFSWSMQFWPEERVQEWIIDEWTPPPEKIQENLAVYRGDYWGQVAYRSPKIFMFHTFAYIFFGAWRTGGVMLLGMALFKSGVLRGERSRRFYATMVALGALVGLPLIAFGVSQNAARGWTGEYSMMMGVQHNYWGSLLVAGGWIGVVMLAYRSQRLRGLTDSLAAVGRMAFSNYIGQTIICTSIFYGWGLGLFASVDRVGQMLIVIAVFAVQLAVSPLWLYYFRFGPLEWLWRSLSYRRLQPMRVERVPVAGVTETP